MSTALALTLTPHGHLVLAPADDAPALPADLSRRLEESFAHGSGHGLLRLDAAEVETALPPALAYWREFGARDVTAVCTQSDVDSREHTPIPTPPIAELETIACSAPPMTGAEYLAASVLQTLWDAIDVAFRSELAESKASVQDFLKSKSSAWNLVGRVHFNLAENRQDDEAPFAFLTTYTTRLSADAKAQHLPLGRALSEYAGAANRSRLLSLLVPVQRAAEQCPWLKTMVDAGEMFHPLRWTPAEAFQLLTDLPRLESAGVIVRVPSTWRANHPPRPQVSVTPGSKPPSGLGKDALLMGLGKTMQVLALLLVLQKTPVASGAGRRGPASEAAWSGGGAPRLNEDGRRTSVLVAPASLIANWVSEITRFAPSLRALVAHPSEMSGAELRALDENRLADVDLVLYGIGARLDEQPELLFLSSERRQSETSSLSTCLLVVCGLSETMGFASSGGPPGEDLWTDDLFGP